MRAIGKAVVFAVLAWSGTARAEPVSMTDPCAYMASVDEDDVHSALISLSKPVMGKYPEHWNDTDYANLEANARACQGVQSPGRKKFDAQRWIVRLEDAKRQNTPVSSASALVSASYAQYWKRSDEFPPCVTFLKWQRDDTWFTDNSKDLFGTDFLDMDKDTMSFYKTIASACIPTEKLILERWRIKADTADDMTKSIAASMDMAFAAKQEHPEELPEKLLVYHGGKRVPLAYLMKTTQDVVLRLASLDKENRVMSTNALIQITKWANQIVATGKQGPDYLYAQRILAISHDEIFKSVDQIKDLGAASAKPR